VTHLHEFHLRTGGDPRTHAHYAALRDELNKLTHPARPDINWSYAETLCLSLFEHNGIELQSAAWFTLARTQLAGLRGMNEGLAILDALITRQWGSLWPQAVHTRVEILSTLARRLQQHLRMQVLSYSDLGAIYQAEKHLSTITDSLQRLELKHQTGLDALGQQLHHSAARIENSSDTWENRSVPPVVLPPAAIIGNASDHARRLVWVLPPPSDPRVTVMPEPPSRPWRPFVAGMLTMLVAGTLSVWAATRLTTDPDQQALMATVAPLPAPLPAARLDALKSRAGQYDSDWLTRAQAQLDTLSRQSPAWSLDYGHLLVRQAQYLWPAQPATAALTRQWQQHLIATAAPPESLKGWRQGMTRLQQLTNRLNGLDEQKGKYMTVSELKSQIFAITQAFNQTVPAEERLRQLATQLEGAPVQAVLREQTALHLKQLLARYALLTPPQADHQITP